MSKSDEWWAYSVSLWVCFRASVLDNLPWYMHSERDIFSVGDRCLVQVCLRTSPCVSMYFNSHCVPQFANWVEGNSTDLRKCLDRAEWWSHWRNSCSISRACSWVLPYSFTFASGIDVSCTHLLGKEKHASLLLVLPARRVLCLWWLQKVFVQTCNRCLRLYLCCRHIAWNLIWIFVLLVAQVATYQVSWACISLYRP